MKSRWDEAQAARCAGELALRAYSSRLLGGDPTLVLHGGGNTSLKLEQDGRCVLYVKATGSDLAQVDETAFTPLPLDAVLRLLERETLDNTQMMAALKASALRPAAPRPSIETLMHAALPFRCVEHTHADAVLAAMNVEDMARVHASVYGDLAPLVPYRHSGHALARACRTAWREQATPRTIGLILAFHGVVAFGADARTAYHNMIELVSRAERHLDAHGAPPIRIDRVPVVDDLPAALRPLHQRIESAAGIPLAACRVGDATATAFARRDDLPDLTQQGPATPQHAVYTRRVALIDEDVAAYAARYRANLDASLGTRASALLDAAPRIALDPVAGLCAFGTTPARARIAAEMYYHDMAVMRAAAMHGRYRSAPPEAIALAEFEYGGHATRMACTTA